jgi:hypothetical protein
MALAKIKNFTFGYKIFRGRLNELA